MPYSTQRRKDVLGGSLTIKEHGPSVYHHVLQALGDRLLAELQAMMNGVETDKASLAQAAEIIKAATELQRVTLSTPEQAAV